MIFVKLVQFLFLPCKNFVAYIRTCKVTVNRKLPTVTLSHTHTNVLLINSWNDLRRHGWDTGYDRCSNVNT